MTTNDEREALSEFAVQTGWDRRNADRTDYYTRAPVRVHVIWQGNSAISGGALYHDEDEEGRGGQPRRHAEVVGHAADEEPG